MSGDKVTQASGASAQLPAWAVESKNAQEYGAEYLLWELLMMKHTSRIVAAMEIETLANAPESLTTYHPNHPVRQLLSEFYCEQRDYWAQRPWEQ